MAGIGRKDVDRRRALLGLAAAACGAVAGPTLAQPATVRALKKVTLVYGVPVIDSSADGFFASIPVGMGFYAEEGLDVDIQAVNGASAAVNLLASGRANFSTHGTAGLFSGVGNNVPMQGFICQVPDYFGSLAVLKDGPIQRIEDLRGKVIGVNANGGAPHLVMRAVFQNLGWNPDSDVEYLAVGTSLPALDALRRGRVQALALWDSVFALFEFNGGEFRYFRPPPFPQLGFTHATNTLTSTIERDPEMVRGVARAMAKSIVVMASAEPAELAKLHFKHYPASRPTALSDAEAQRLDGLRLAARKSFMRLPQRVEARAERLGDIADGQILAHAQLLKDGGQIPEVLAADRYFTRAFVPAMNEIDVPRIVAQARAFRA